MGIKYLRTIIFFAFSVLVFCTARASAQAPLEPAQLPSRTTFYLIWRGAPAAEARKANALLGLWDDPGFAPVRSAFVEALLSDSQKEKSAQALTKEELEEYSTLLDNPFVLGYLGEPESHRAARADLSNDMDHAWNGLFFAYDRTGKEALVSKAILRLRSQEKDIPKISQFTVGGAQALKVERKTGITYWAETGKYAISANNLSVFEEILGRAAGKPAEASSLAQTSAYEEAKPLLGTGMFEFFLRVSNLKDLAKGTSPSGVPLQAILDAVKLDSVHSISGHVTLEGAKTRVQAAILGNATPGTLFDIWADGQQSPASLALLPPEAIYYSETQFNLPAIYETVKRALRATLPQGQRGNADMIDALAEPRLGMPLTEALALTTGEFASMQTSPWMDPAKQVYILGIRKKPETLKLIRTIFGDRLTSERNEGDTTYLKISLHGGQSNAGVAQWNFYHLAVTPEVLIGSSRSETLRTFLARRAAPGNAAASAAPVAFQAARSQFPEKLNGLGFFDFQKLDWQAVKDKWVADMKSAAEKQNASGKSETAFPVPDWLLRADLQIFPRHLHSTISASWKDTQGLHFDQWLE